MCVYIYIYIVCLGHYFSMWRKGVHLKGVPSPQKKTNPKPKIFLANLGFASKIMPQKKQFEFRPKQLNQDIILISIFEPLDRILWTISLANEA